jgi:uncharacterized protein (DUF2126 family)
VCVEPRDGRLHTFLPPLRELGDYLELVAAIEDAALELGLPVVWINRLGEAADPEPTRELPDLAGLPDALDELVPA